MFWIQEINDHFSSNQGRCNDMGLYPKIPFAFWKVQNQPYKELTCNLGWFEVHTQDKS